MKLLKTYLAAVAIVCEFGLSGGYLEASIISQLNLTLSGPDFFFADAASVQIFPDFFVIMAVTSARYF